MWSPCSDDTFPPSPSCLHAVISSIRAVSAAHLMIELRVLGTLAIQSREGGPPIAAVTQPKRLALLLYLALAEPAGSHSRDSLVALLWPEADDDSTRHSLRNTLYGLRQALGEGAIVSRGEGYVELDPAAIRCDAVEVRALLAARRWEEALAGWGGDVAPGFHVSGAPEFERWLDDQRAALRRAVADAGWRRVDEMERNGEPGVGEAARQAWAIDPANEAGARRLMQLLEVTSGRAAALRAYDDLADYLRREFETLPSAETRAIADRLSAVEAPPPPSPPRAAPSAILAVAPSASPPPRRPLVFTREALIAGAILVGVAASLVALRSPCPAACRRAAGRKVGPRARAASSCRRVTERIPQPTARTCAACPCGSRGSTPKPSTPSRPWSAGPQLSARAGRPGAFLWPRHPRRPDTPRRRVPQGRRSRPAGHCARQHARRRPTSSSAGSRWPVAGISRWPDS